MLLISLVVLIAWPIFPVILLFLFFYHYLKSAWIISNLPSDPGEYWLDKKQKDTLRNAWDEYGDLLCQESEIMSIIQDHDLDWNLDGRLSARSRIGKELRPELESIQDRMERLSDSIAKFCRRPYRRWENDFLRYVSHRVVMRASMFGFATSVLLALIIISVRHFHYLQAIPALSDVFVGDWPWLAEAIRMPVFCGSLIGAIVFKTLSGYEGWFPMGGYFFDFCPPPPEEVTPENIDEYIKEDM